MLIHHGIDQLPTIKNAVVTSGTFDGVHLGHRHILKRLQQIAKQSKGESVVITFWPHPRLVLFPESGDNLKLLNTFEEKAKLLEEVGIDHLVRIPFTKEFSRLTSVEFINQVLIDKLNTKKLVIGYDHKFGRNREGSFEHLKANAQDYGFEVEEIPRQDIENVGVSSTLIRKTLSEGKVEESNKYLSHPYTISGQVIKGKQLGRTLGFPTANISINNPYKLIPSNGVYAVRAELNSISIEGMLNIGVRPTVDGKLRSIEVHLFDFDKEIYGKTLTLNLIKRVREEIKFKNTDELKNQLMKDEKLVIEILNH